MEDQINQLLSEISATKRRRNELLSSNRDPAAIALTEEIVETEKRLRVLIEQRGNLPRTCLHTPIPPVFYSNPFNNIFFAQLLSTPHLLPFRFGNDAR